MHKRSKLHPRPTPVPPRRLARLFQEIARCALLGSAAAAGACASSSQPGGDPNLRQDVPAGQPPGAGPGVTPTAEMPTGPGGPPTAGASGPGPETPAPTLPVGEPIACADGQPRLLGELTSPLAMDDAIVRVHAYQDEWVEPPIKHVTVLETLGMPCASASDAASCEEAYASARDPEQRCTEAACGPALIATTGTGVLVATAGTGDLSAILGQIDTLDEAALVAWLNNHPIRCEVGTGLQAATVERSGDGFLLRYESYPCGEEHVRRLLRVDASGEVVIEEEEVLEPPNCDVGRRPDGGCLLARGRGASALGRYLATMASLEAASVVSFARIARELSAFGAPNELIQAALDAARDEVRHTKLVSALSQRFGGQPQACQLAPMPLRDRSAFALDNGVEGCVRETYGALVATYQALRASDPLARETLAQIAADETRHAELSWRLFRFIDPQLSETERDQVRAAQLAVVAELGQSLERELPPREAALIGLPDAPTARALLSELTRALLS